MFGDVVLGIPHDDFEAAIRRIKAEAGVTFDIELGAQHLKQLVEEYKKVWKCVTCAHNLCGQLAQHLAVLGQGRDWVRGR